MIESTIVDLIANTGFPIAISIYFIFKVQKVVENNTIALTRFVEETKKR